MSQYNLTIGGTYDLLIGGGYKLFIDAEVSKFPAAKRWDGTKWVRIYSFKEKDQILKYYNGTEWQLASIV